LEQLRRTFNLNLRHLLVNINGLFVCVQELFVVLSISSTQWRRWKRRKLNISEGHQENCDGCYEHVPKNEKGQLVADPLQRLQLSTRDLSININL